MFPRIVDICIEEKENLNSRFNSDRFQSKQDAIRHNINLYNPLFDGLQMIPTSGKSSMVEELKAYLKEEDWNEETSVSVFVIDFMSFIRCC